jgi:hypothetical protein
VCVCVCVHSHTWFWKLAYVEESQAISVQSESCGTGLTLSCREDRLRTPRKAALLTSVA